MGAAAQLIRKGRKFDQVLMGARQIFLSHGFEGASVDDIAREAGVSKATLYSYFPDKRLLFLEVAKAECCRQADKTEAMVSGAHSAQEVLTIAAMTLVEFFTSPFFIRLFRIFVAESERFPELGREFYESGPKLGKARIAAYLTEAEARGELRVPDKALAADQLTELCKADLFPKLVFGIVDTVSPADRRRIAEGAVAVFLARYKA
jgi:TetR/AcrR family transcriptional regulator, mexJK operon transcriptional repressor